MMVSVLLFVTAQLFSLYTDNKANQVGDVVTVVLVEEIKGLHEVDVEIDKDAGLSAEHSVSGWTSLISKLKIPLSASFGVKGSNSHSGKGETSRKNVLQGFVSCVVKEVLPNGNLVIEGSREVRINRERGIVEVSGIVRPEDIMPDNTVLSINIADAKIKYIGRGYVSGGTKKGIFHRLIDWIF